MTTHSLIIHLVYWIALTLNIGFLYMLADPKVWIFSKYDPKHVRFFPIAFLIGTIANASLISYYYFFI